MILEYILLPAGGALIGTAFKATGWMAWMKSKPAREAVKAAAVRDKTSWSAKQVADWDEINRIEKEEGLPISPRPAHAVAPAPAVPEAPPADPLLGVDVYRTWCPDTYGRGRVVAKKGDECVVRWARGKVATYKRSELAPCTGKAL